MVTLMLISHSRQLAEGLCELALEMAPGAAIIPIGGAKSGGLGSDFDRTFQNMEKAAAACEVVVLADMGSSKTTAEMAREALDAPLQERVFLCDAAFVEGAVSAAAGVAGGLGAGAILASLQEYLLDK